jgi:acyl dehydratase
VLDLRPGTWDDARRLIGKPIAELVGASPIEAEAVRRLLEVHEWDLPPAYDREAARQAGFRGLIAPPSTYTTFAMPAYWSPGDPPLGEGLIPPFPFRHVPGKGSMMIATAMAVRFGAPLVVGDVLHSQWWLSKVAEKSTSVGDGAFLEFDAVVRNQRGEVVAHDRTTTLRYEPRSDAGTSPSPPPSIDDGKIAKEIGPCSIALTLQRLVMAAGANRDLAPVHHDPRVASQAGLGQPFANSMFVLTHLDRTMTEWAGWRSRVVAIDLRLVTPALADTTMTATGRRVDDRTTDLAQCELVSRIEPGGVHATATAEIRLARATHL